MDLSRHEGYIYINGNCFNRYTLKEEDTVLLVESNGYTITIDLPNPTTFKREAKRRTIKRIGKAGSDANGWSKLVLLSTNEPTLVNDCGCCELGGARDSVDLIEDGHDWHVI
jgi:hypothetical protein